MNLPSILLLEHGAEKKGKASIVSSLTTTIGLWKNVYTKIIT